MGGHATGTTSVAVDAMALKKTLGSSAMIDGIGKLEVSTSMQRLVVEATVENDSVKRDTCCISVPVNESPSSASNPGGE